MRPSYRIPIQPRGNGRCNRMFNGMWLIITIAWLFLTIAAGHEPRPQLRLSRPRRGAPVRRGASISARLLFLGLTRAQCRVLGYLARNEGINQAGLADLLEIQPMTLVRQIDRMEEDGWIERRPDPGDRRARRLVLTDKARPILARILDLSNEMRDEAFAGLSRRRRTAADRAVAPGARQSVGARAAARRSRRTSTRRADRRPTLGRRRRGDLSLVGGPAMTHLRRERCRSIGALRVGVEDRPGARAPAPPAAPAAAAAVDGRRADRRAPRRRLLVPDERPLRLDRRRLCPGGADRSAPMSPAGSSRCRRRATTSRSRPVRCCSGSTSGRSASPSRRPRRSSPRCGCQVEALKATYQQKLADARAAEATLAYQQREFERQKRLLASGTASQAAIRPGRAKPMQAGAPAARRQAAGRRQHARQPRRRPRPPGRPAPDGAARPGGARPGRARPVLHRWSHAPENGIVTKVEQLQVGDYVNAATPVFSLMSTDRVWVEANFKETELTHMRAGPAGDGRGRHLSRCRFRRQGRRA